MKRSKLLMIISVIVFLLSLVYAWVETPRLKKAPLPIEAKKIRSMKPSGELSQVESEGRLRVDLLTRENAAFSGVKRDLFTGAAGRKTPPPAPVIPPPESVRIDPLPEPEPVPEQIEIAPIAEVVRTQLAQFTFLGYLKKGHQQSIFLVESGEIFVVKQADRFGKEAQFEVKLIATDKMTVLDINNGGTISVSLVEQASLVPDEVPRQAQVAPLSMVTREPTPDAHRNDSPLDDSETVMPPHMLPPMPPGTKIPPSWHNSPRGIPHE